MNQNITEQKKNILKDSVKYISSKYVAQFLGIIISVATKSFLGPIMVGVWSILQVILDYCDYSSLGTAKAAFREIPYYQGRKEYEKAERVKNEVFTFTFIMALLPAVGMLVYALFSKNWTSVYMFWGLIYVALVVVFKRIFEYYNTILRANKEFGVISWITVMMAVLNLVFTFTLVRYFKIYGLFIASFLSLAIGYLTIYLKTRYRFRFQLSKSGISKMVGIGIPLVVIGLCSQTIRNLDKILIMITLGATSLGHYTIGTMVYAYIIALPTSFAVVLFPRLQEKYGELGSPSAIKNYLTYPILSVCVLVGFFAGLSILVVPFLVYLILPAFIPGIAAMKILLWATFFRAAGSQARTYLVTIDKQWNAVWFYLGGVCITALFIYSFLRQGWGLPGAALGMVLGSATYNIATIAYGKSFFARLKEISLFIGVMLATFLYYLVITIGLSSLGQDNHLGWVCWRALCYLVLSLPVFWLLDRKTHLFRTLLNIVSEKLKKSRPEQ